jgi:hypothetical protein
MGAEGRRPASSGDTCGSGKTDRGYGFACSPHGETSVGERERRGGDSGGDRRRWTDFKDDDDRANVRAREAWELGCVRRGLRRCPGGAYIGAGGEGKQLSVAMAINGHASLIGNQEGGLRRGNDRVMAGE